MRVTTLSFARLCGVVAAMALALMLTVALTPAAAQAADRTVERLYGPERITTAVAVAQTYRGAGHALLATAESFPDALSAGALAARFDAPLLLTPGDALPVEVLDELHRLGTRTVWLLGGHQAIGPAVEQRLDREGFIVRRIQGPDRYETARALALAAGSADSREVVVTLGEHPEAGRAWADAVAAGALSALPDPLPVLLTRPTELPEATRSALAELETRQVIVVGGTSAIAPAVEQQLQDLGYTVRRIAGTTRYGTSVRLAQESRRRAGDSASALVLASGGAFPDALSAGALAALRNGPLVLTDPRELPKEVDDFIRTGDWDAAALVGGPSAADDWVIKQVDAALQGEPRPEHAALSAAPEQEHERFEGWASWYGANFAGRRTASGEPFDHHALTAAHRSLPFGTILRVTNTANGAQVEVRINDRGPYVGDRVLDLSERAAMELGYRDHGTAHVIAEILSTP